MADRHALVGESLLLAFGALLARRAGGVRHAVPAARARVLGVLHAPQAVHVGIVKVAILALARRRPRIVVAVVRHLGVLRTRVVPNARGQIVLVLVLAGGTGVLRAVVVAGQRTVGVLPLIGAGRLGGVVDGRRMARPPVVPMLALLRAHA